MTLSAPRSVLTASSFLVVTAFLAPQRAQAQASRAPLAAVEQRMKAGDFRGAWDALAQMSESDEVLRLRVRTAVGLQQAEAALTAYERLIVRRPPERPLLKEIASGVLRSLAAHEDPLIRIARCEALPEPDETCRQEALRAAQDRSAPVAARASAAVMLLRAGDGRGPTVLHSLRSSSSASDQLALALSLDQAPPAVAEGPLLELLASPHPQVQYLAASALEDIDTPRTKAALRRLAKTGRGPAKLAAVISLARLGDHARLDEVGSALELLDGGDLLAAGEALARAGDPRGVAAIRRVSEGPHETLRLEAARGLTQFDRAAAAKVIEEGLTSSNPWIRAQALDVARRSGWTDTPKTRILLADGDAWVRLRAAQHVVAPAPQSSHGNAQRR